MTLLVYAWASLTFGAWWAVTVGKEQLETNYATWWQALGISFLVALLWPIAAFALLYGLVIWLSGGDPTKRRGRRGPGA